MGFTFSHPALVLPFRYLPKHTYSLSGLVIGSMVPDFEYFLRFSNTSHYSHTLPGLFWFDVPLGLLLCVLFHEIIRQPLIRNLPVFLKARLAVYEQVNWAMQLKRHWFRISGSLLLGAFTHLIWDSVTSQGGFFVERYPNFFYSEITILGVPVYVSRIFKYSSSILGLLMLVLVLMRMPKQQTPLPKKDRYYWLIYITTFTFILCLRLSMGVNEKASFAYIKTLIASGLLAFLFVSVYYKWPGSKPSI